MKQNALLTIASLLSILFLTFHLADDIVRGFEKGGPSNLLAIPILVLWLYGTLVLADRRSGQVITLLGSLLGVFVTYVHFTLARGVAGGEIAKSLGGWFFVWTLIAIGGIAGLGVVLAAQGLWRSFRVASSAVTHDRVQSVGNEDPGRRG